MSSIDKRIVEMQFDNQQFEKGIETSTRSLEGLKKSLITNTAEDGLSSLGRAADIVSQRFSALGIMGDQVLRRITDAAINAGKNIIKSLSTDQISAGMTKYEQKTASVQTIMNATGKSIDEVSGYLDKLMWFSDETSYGFTDMTSALATMVSSGGDIDKLIPMITGVANATAFAGKGAAEFSRVMQFGINQAYSLGHMQVMDWKSIEGATVNSKQLMETLIAAGEAAGTLKKGQVTVKNFRQSLADKWLTSNVMESGFGRFSELSEAAYEAVKNKEYETAAEAIEALSGKYSDLSVNAFKSAQTAKTFTEAIYATKDAVSSGWMRSIEIVVGNLEEAKVLFTELTSVLWGVFASGAEARNEILTTWKELGGRESLLQSIRNIWNTIYTISKAIGNAFKEIFPPKTGKDLARMTDSFQKFTKSILDWLLDPVGGVTRFGKITKIFKGFFSIFKIGGKVLSSVGDAILDVFKPLVPGAVDGVLDFFANFGDSITKFAEDLDLSNFTAKLKKWISDLKSWFAPAWNWLKQAAIDIGDAIKNFFGIGKTPVAEGEQTGWQKLLTTLRKWYEDVKAFFTPAWNWLKQAAIDIGDAIKNFFGIGKTPVAEGEQTGWQKLLTTLRKWYEDVKAFFTPAWTWLSDNGAILLESIKDFFGVGKTPLAEGEQTGFQKMLTTLKKWYEDVKVFFMPAWTWLSDNGAILWESIKDFFGVGKTPLAEGEQTGWQKLLGTLREWYAEVQEFFGTIWGWLKQAAIDIWDAIKTFFGFKEPSKSNGAGGGGGAKPGSEQTGFQKMLTTLKKWYEDVKAFFMPAWTWLSDNGAILWETIKDFFGVGKTPLAEGEQSGWQKLLTTLRKWYEDVKAFFMPAWTWLSDNGAILWESIKDFFGVGKTPLAEGEQSGWQKLLTTAKGWYAELEEYFAPVIEWIKQAAKDIKEGLTDLFSGVGEKDTPEGTKSVFVQIKDLLGQPKDIELFLADFVAIIRNAWTDFKLKVAEIFAKNDNVAGVDSKPGAFDGVLSVLKKISDWFSENWGGITTTIAGVAIGAGLLKIISTFNNLTKIGLVIVRAKEKLPVGSVYQTFGDTILKIAGAVVLVAGSIIALTLVDQTKLREAELVVGGITLTLAALTGLGQAIMKVPAGFTSGSFGLSMLGIAGAVFLTIISIQMVVNVIRSIQTWGDLTVLAGAITSIGLVILAFSAVLRSLNGVSFGGGVIKVGGFIGFSAGVWIIVQAIMPFKDLSEEAMNRITSFLWALDLTLLALTALTRFSPPGSGLRNLVSMVGLAGLTYVIGETLIKIQPVDTAKIDSVLGGIKDVLYSFGVYTALAGRISFTGLAVALAGIIGVIFIIMGVVSTFSLLQRNEDFQNFVNEGAGSIGEMIGTFIGSMKAGEMTAFARGLDGFKSIKVDKSDVQNAIDVAKLLQEFADALPDKTFGQVLLDTILGTPMEGLKKNITDFATMINDLGKSLGTIKFSSSLEGTIKDVLAAMGVLNTFILGLDAETKTIGEAAEKALGVDAWSKKVGRFNEIAGVLTTFAGDLETFNTTTKDFDTTKVTNAINALVRVKNIIQGLKSDTTDSGGDTWNAQIKGFEDIAWRIGFLGERLGVFKRNTEGMDYSSVSAFITAVSELTTAIGNLQTTVTAESVDLVINLIADLSGVLTTDLVGAVATGIQSSADSVIKEVQDIGTRALAAIRSYYTSFLSVGTYLGQGVAKGLRASIKDVISAANAVAKAAADAANKESEIASPSKVFAKIGMFMDEGLAAGIKKYSYKATSSIITLAKQVHEAFNDVMQINSPSRTMLYGGRDVVLGVANGITNNIPVVVDASKTMANAMVTGFTDEVEALQNGAGWWKSAIDSVKTFDIVPEVNQTGLKKLTDTLSKDQKAILAKVYKPFETITTKPDTTTTKNPVVISTPESPIIEISSPTSGYQQRVDASSINTSAIAARVDRVGTIGVGLNQASELAALLNKLDLLNSNISGMQIVMDSGALVGQISTKLDRQLGIQAAYAGRR